MTDDAARDDTVLVFGGSFDPPHVGHVLAATYALLCVPARRLLVVPTFEHPLGKRSAAPYDARVELAEAAFRELRVGTVSRIEEELGGPSRTLRTLEALRARMPRTRLRLVIGADVFADTSRWHAFDRVAALAPPLVVGRQSSSTDPSLSSSTGGASGDDPHVSLPPVSSTEIRARLRRGLRVDGLVPARVLERIEARRLYRDDETSPPEAS